MNGARKTDFHCGLRTSSGCRSRGRILRKCVCTDDLTDQTGGKTGGRGAFHELATIDCSLIKGTDQRGNRLSGFLRHASSPA